MSLSLKTCISIIHNDSALCPVNLPQFDSERGLRLQAEDVGKAWSEPRVADPTPAEREPTDAETEILAGLRLLIEPGQKFEIRIPHLRRPDWDGPRTYYRHYRNEGEGLRNAARWAAEQSPFAPAVYFTLNPLKHRRKRRKNRPAGSAVDDDIRRRRWLLIDFDPRRETNTSATDAEKEQARLLLQEIREDLALWRGWPDPVVADSGNGYHLLFRIDLPNTEKSRELIESVLDALAAQYNNDAVTIDTTVSNASRICKLYGTKSRKGEETPGRPHRFARVLEVPEPLAIVPVEQIKALAQEAPAVLVASGTGCKSAVRISGRSGQAVATPVAPARPDGSAESQRSAGLKNRASKAKRPSNKAKRPPQPPANPRSKPPADVIPRGFQKPLPKPPGAGRAGDVANLLPELKANFPLVGPGHRHTTMNRAVGSLIGRSYDNETITSVVMAWWEHFHAHGLTRTDRPGMEHELEACLRSTRNNEQFTIAHGTTWHRNRCREIELSPAHRQILATQLHLSLDGNQPQGRARKRLRPKRTKTNKNCIGHTFLVLRPREAAFVEAVIVLSLHEIQTGRVARGGVIRMTNRQIMDIASDRHPEVTWVSDVQVEREKRKFIGRPDDGKPATKSELLREICKGKRQRGQAVGVPSEYQLRGLGFLLELESRWPPRITPDNRETNPEETGWESRLSSTKLTPPG